MKSQDIIVAIKLLILNEKKSSFAKLGKLLKISASEVHGAARRLKESYLLDSFTGMIRKPALEEFLIHGIQYAFPAAQDKPARGILTGYSSPFMKNEFDIVNSSELFVWPYSFGNNRGISIKPLYKTVPEVCGEDEGLYHWLAVIDMLRMNRAREREVAIKHLKNLFLEIK
jgi:hypothetical protein